MIHHKKNGFQHRALSNIIISRQKDKTTHVNNAKILYASEVLNTQTIKHIPHSLEFLCTFIRLNTKNIKIFFIGLHHTRLIWNYLSNRDPVVDTPLFFIVPLGGIRPVYISIFLNVKFTTLRNSDRLILTYIHSITLSAHISIFRIVLPVMGNINYYTSTTWQKC